MRHPGAQRRESERGQASVELLGTLPAALLVALVAWQLLLAGQAVWLTANAARVAARAQAVGEDPEAAARSALPDYLDRRLEVQADRGGNAVRLRVHVPLLLRRFSSPLEVGARAGFVRQLGTTRGGREADSQDFRRRSRLDIP
jgi:hypothetical protein